MGFLYIKITDSKSIPFLVGYASFQEWPNKFTNMMDKARESNANISLLGD